MPSTPLAGWVPDLSDFPRYSDAPFALESSDDLASPAGQGLIIEDVVAALAGQGSTVPPIAWAPGTEATSELTWWGRVTRLRIGIHASVDDAAGEIVRACRGHEVRDRLGWLLAASTYPITLIVLAPLRRLGVVGPWSALGIFVGMLALACVLARIYSRRLDRHVAAEVRRLLPIRRPGDRRDAPMLDAADVVESHP